MKRGLLLLLVLLGACTTPAAPSAEGEAALVSVVLAGWVTQGGARMPYAQVSVDRIADGRRHGGWLVRAEGNGSFEFRSIVPGEYIVGVVPCGSDGSTSPAPGSNTCRPHPDNSKFLIVSVPPGGRADLHLEFGNMHNRAEVLRQAVERKLLEIVVNVRGSEKGDFWTDDERKLLDQAARRRRPARTP